MYLAAANLLVACDNTSQPTQVSEQPAQLAEISSPRTAARTGRFGLRSRIAYTDVQTLIAEMLPAQYPVQDSKKLCKRLLGIKTCGTAHWDLTVSRSGDLVVSGEAQHIKIQAPIKFDGVVGIDGRVAKALGLSKLDVNGSVIADINLGLELDQTWCPTLSVSINYIWVETPTAVWRNSVDFSLESIVNDALDKQLARLAPRINNAIQCDRFREQLERHWKTYSFEFDLPVTSLSSKTQKMHLNLYPTGFSFSGIQTFNDKLGFGFVVDSTAAIEPEALSPEQLSLPLLERIDYLGSDTEFDILLRATYEQLQEILQAAVQGKSYRADSIAGAVQVTISAITLSSNTGGVTVSVGFVAKLPGKRTETIGTVFLSADPLVDTAQEIISLGNIRISKVIDSTLWELLSQVFETKIISAIERSTTIDYADRVRELERKMITQLQDSSRTGGLIVNPQDLSIQLIDIIPEAGALVALARVSAKLDIDIPLDLINNATQ